MIVQSLTYEDGVEKMKEKHAKAKGVEIIFQKNQKIELLM